MILVYEFDRKSNGEPGQLGREIIRKRFESYNKVWLTNVPLSPTNNDGFVNSPVESIVSGNYNFGSGQSVADGYGYNGANAPYLDHDTDSVASGEGKITMMNSAKFFNNKVEEVKFLLTLTFPMNNSYVYSLITRWSGKWTQKITTRWITRE